MKKSNTFNTVAALSVGLTLGGTAGINPVLQEIMETYPEVPAATIYLVSTLPSLLSMVVSLLIGMIVGQKLKFKTCLLTGLVLFLLGGTLPVFIACSFPLLLALRCVFGIALGMLACTSALIMRMFTGDACAKNLGYYIFIVNIGAVLIQFISGVLADISLSLSFCVYFIGAIPLLLVLFFLREPESGADSAAAGQSRRKLQIRPINILYAGIQLLGVMWLYPLLANMASYLTEQNLGGAAMAGTILSLYSIAGALGGAAFGKLYAKLGKYIMAFIFGLTAIGQLIVIIGSSIPVVILGTVLCGFSHFCVSPMLMMFTNSVTPQDSVPVNTSLLNAGNSLGIFISGYWIQLCGTIFGGNLILGPFAVCVVCCAAVSLLTCIKDPRPKSTV